MACLSENDCSSASPYSGGALLRYYIRVTGVERTLQWERSDIGTLNTTFSPPMFSLLKKFRYRKLFLKSNVAAMPVPAARLAALRPDDQFLVSYPRSGNTWLRHLLRDVISSQYPEVPYPKELWMLIPDLHRSEHPMVHPAQDQFQLATRILKSHNLNELDNRRFIYLVRNPADALVSYYHFFRMHERTRELGVEGVDAFCKVMVKGWAAHVSIALDQYRKNPSEVLIATYENLMADGVSELRRIAQFLGFTPSEATLLTILERNSFNQLRAREVVHQGAAATSFFRKGQPGTAQEEIARETLDLIESVTSEVYSRARHIASGTPALPAFANQGA